MDNSGHWHDSEIGARAANEVILRNSKSPITEQRTRPVISIEIGEAVAIVKNGGDFIRCSFDRADKNKVFLTPLVSEEPQPFLNIAEYVQLQRHSGENVSAQVWENRKGQIVLRTLPT